MSDEIDDAKTLCYCKNVTYGDVRRAVESGDLRNVEQVVACTSAGAGCRSCHPEIRAVLAAYCEKKGTIVSRFLKRFFPESK